jgi:hypothetical protein
MRVSINYDLKYNLPAKKVVVVVAEDDSETLANVKLLLLEKRTRDAVDRRIIWSTCMQPPY